MEIKEMQELKITTQDKINDTLREFQEKTGLKRIYVSVSYSNTSNNNGIEFMETEITAKI